MIWSMIMYYSLSTYCTSYSQKHCVKINVWEFSAKISLLVAMQNYLGMKFTQHRRILSHLFDINSLTNMSVYSLYIISLNFMSRWCQGYFVVQVLEILTLELERKVILTISQSYFSLVKCKIYLLQVILIWQNKTQTCLTLSFINVKRLLRLALWTSLVSPYFRAFTEFECIIA